MEDEVIKELHEIRANIVSEHSHDNQKLDAYFQSLRFPGFTYGIPGRTFKTEAAAYPQSWATSPVCNGCASTTTV